MHQLVEDENFIYNLLARSKNEIAEFDAEGDVEEALGFNFIDEMSEYLSLEDPFRLLDVGTERVIPLFDKLSDALPTLAVIIPALEDEA